MKDDYTTNSHYVTYVGLGVKGVPKCYQGVKSHDKIMGRAGRLLLKFFVIAPEIPRLIFLSAIEDLVPRRARLAEVQKCAMISMISGSLYCHTVLEFRRYAVLPSTHPRPSYCSTYESILPRHIINTPYSIVQRVLRAGIVRVARIFPSPAVGLNYRIRDLLYDCFFVL